MGKIAIVTDSTAYLSDELKKEWDIHVVPLNVIFGEDTYHEEVDLLTSDFYDKIKIESQLPTTSQPAIGIFVEVYENLAKQGFDSVISIHLSSHISGTYQSAMSAADMVEGIQIHGFDSKISCTPQAYFVLEAAKHARAGKSVEEILAQLEAMRTQVNAYFVVDDLNHLHRGGRLNTAQLFVGSLLKIKPVLHFVDGKIVPFEKVRTTKKALNRIYGLLDEAVKNKENPQITVIHAQCQEQAEEIASHLKETYPKAQVDISYFGPVIGTHLGQGSIGIAWFVE